MMLIKNMILIAVSLKYELAKVFLFVCLFAGMIVFLAEELNYNTADLIQIFHKFF